MFEKGDVFVKPEDDCGDERWNGRHLNPSLLKLKS